MVKHVPMLQVLLSCLLVPLWLMLLRELLQQDQQQQAIVAALAGLALLLASDIIYRSTETTHRALAAQLVTADSLQQSEATTSE